MNKLPIILLALTLGIQAAPADNILSGSELVWNSPSKDEHDSMPLGNGETGINAWVQSDGTLHFYLARTDAWSGNGRLLKLGRVELCFEPNPFAADDFQQVLDVDQGEMRVRSGDFQLRLWVDAHDDLVRMEAGGDLPRSLSVRNRPWRTEDREVDCSASGGEVHSFFNLRKGPENAVIRADLIMDQAPEGLLWCHHNDHSLWEANLRGQALGPLVERQTDPLLHRTFGVLVQGKGLQKKDRMTLESSQPARQHYLTARTHTAFCEQPEEWAWQILAKKDTHPETARTAHLRWWGDHAARSYIRLASTSNESAPPPLIKQPSGHFHIGTCQQTKFSFRGSMAYLKIYGDALRPEQIDSGDTEPRAAFDFSATTAQAGVYPDAQDPSRTARNRGQTTQVTQEEQTGVAFDGKSWLAVPNKEGILPPRAVTIDALIRPDKQDRMGARILDFSTLYSKPQEGLILDTYPGNSLRLITPAGNLQAQGQVLAVGKWQRATASYDAATGAAAIYLDGKLIAEETFEPAEALESGGNSIQERVANLSRAYRLQRYMNACAGRGNFPIKFNGSLFTVSGNEKNEMFDPDYRRWGEPYWFQNTRLPYWSMLAAGDYELMKPLFEMYMNDALETARYRARTLYDAQGAVFPETIMFWGSSPLYIYGWPDERSAEELADGLIRHPMHRYHWTAGIELAAMMLEYYRHTGDDAFARRTLLPLSRDILDFYRSHYDIGDDGKLVFSPSQALESWWNTVNPMPEVAGLRYLLEGLLELPDGLADATQKTVWRDYLDVMPELPMRQLDGQPALWVADQTPVKPKNIEIPELYAIFPFRHYSVGRPDIEVARRAFQARRAKLHTGWSQDDIQAALLGLADEAASLVLSRANSINRKSRFPVFWGPNYDWVPDQDHGSVLLTALQKMLLQSVGDRIFLFPAWPADWNVDFRLHAPLSTTVSGSLRDGKLVSLIVEPESRRKDIEIMSSRITVN